MSILFESLDRYLLEDEPMNSWNKFDGFEKFERKHAQNIRWCVVFLIRSSENLETYI